MRFWHGENLYLPKALINFGCSTKSTMNVTNWGKAAHNLSCSPSSSGSLIAQRFVCLCPTAKHLADCLLPYYGQFGIYVLRERDMLWWAVTAMLTFSLPFGNYFFFLSLGGSVSLCQFGHVRVFLPQYDWMWRDSSRTVPEAVTSRKHTC